MDNIITFLNTTAESFVGFSISMLIQSSVLIIVLLVLDLLLRKKVRAVFLYCIWMLILVKLVLPTTFSSPTGLGYWFGDKVPSIINDKASIPEQTASIIQRIEPVSETIPSGTGIAALPSAGTSPEPTAEISTEFTVAASPATASLSWHGFTFLGWLAVLILMVLLLIRRMLFVRGLLAQSKNPNDSMLDIFEQCRKQMGVHRSVFLKLSPVAASPSVCGLFRPTILIPKNLPGKLKAEDLRSILLHELAHINRGDVWVSLIQTILQIVYFYNPLLWVANVIIRKVREQAVDEMVLVAMGEQAEDYPETLLNISRLTFSRPVLSLRLIGVIESKKALHRRIKIMLNRPVPKNSKLGVLGLIVVIIIGSILLPMAKAQKQSVDNAPSVVDLDKDGLENRLEKKLGTNPKSTDTEVEESDETNNKASRTISTTVKLKPAEITESTKVDIAIDDRNLEVTKLSDALFQVVIRIYNKGSAPSPEFGVYFYAGDPDKGGRLLATHAAGPIMPGDSWAEGTHPQRLESGESTITVVVDPGNKVEESDETNNKASQTISMAVSEYTKVDKVGAIQKVDLAGDDILQVEAQTLEGFNFPYYLFIPSGIDKDRQVYMLVETNNSGMVSDDLEVHRAKAHRLTERSHANRMARQLGVPLLVPTFPRPRTNWWAYTHALDIDTLEIEEGKLKRIDLQLTAMIKYAQEFLRVNGFKINERVFMHGFSASAKFCNRYSFLHPEMVKAVAAGGVNGLPTLPVREWNDCELPFPIGIAGIERFIDGPFNEKAFRQVAHYIYMGSFDRNDTLPSRDAWREEEADIIKKALAEKMMPDRWQLSQKIYHQQKLPAQLVTYNGIAHAIKGGMLDDVTDFFKANSEEKFVRIKPYEYPFVKSKEIRPKYKSESTKVDIAIEDRNFTVIKKPGGLFEATIRIYNKGSIPIPRFRVNFYAGDPDKGGRLLSPQAAGPIKPGGNWGEYNPRLKLRPGENTISVLVDPDNRVEESDETNNKASQTISATVKVKPDGDSDAHPKSKSALRKADIAIENKYLTVKKQPDGRFRAGVSIHNYGNITTPQFKVIFYAGDPGKKGRKVYPGHHNAGPIMPRGTWNEGTLPFTLNEGETEIFVIVDPDNMVEESDETNNKASVAIPGRQRMKSEISEKPKTGHQRYFVRLVVGEDKMTFEGQQVTWEQLPSLLEKVTNRGNTVFKIAVSTKDIPLSRYEAAMSRARKLVKQFGFEYLSYVGQHKLGSKANVKGQINKAQIITEIKSKFSTTLPNGVTVGMVGVCDWPKEGRKCWRPDGLALPVEIYATKWNQSPGVGQYGFMFKVTGPDDLNFSWNKILGASGWQGSCKIVDSQGNQLEGFEAAISDMEKGRLSTTIRVGVAAGPWETIARHDGRRMNSGKQGGVLWSQAFQASSGTHIVASREWRKDQTERVVAIDKEGKLHTTGHGSVASGKIDQLTASFRSLKLGQIEEFQYQVRPYHWGEFKNISLRPGHKTNVQF